MNISGSFLERQDGFTLIELLVAITIGSILTTALMQTFSLQLSVHRREDVRRAAQSTALATMNFLVRNLEQIGREPNLVLFTAANPAIQQADAQTLQYFTNLSTAWSDTDWNDAWENVTFQYNSSDNTIEVVTGGTMSPLTDGGAVQKSYVPPGGLLFTYYDRNNVVVAPGGGAAARASIRRINISLTVKGKVSTGGDEPEISLSQDVFLRNVSNS